MKHQTCQPLDMLWWVMTNQPGLQNHYQSYVSGCYDFKPSPDVLKSAKMACVNYNPSLK
jgi:hypothetical protein